jgi:hypothetical protein
LISIDTVTDQTRRCLMSWYDGGGGGYGYYGGGGGGGGYYGGNYSGNGSNGYWGANTEYFGGGGSLTNGYYGAAYMSASYYGGMSTGYIDEFGSGGFYGSGYYGSYTGSYDASEGSVSSSGSATSTTAQTITDTFSPSGSTTPESVTVTATRPSTGVENITVYGGGSTTPIETITVSASSVPALQTRTSFHMGEQVLRLDGVLGEIIPFLPSGKLKTAVTELRGGLKFIEGMSDFNSLTSGELKDFLSVVIGHVLDGLGAEGLASLTAITLGALTSESGPGAIAAAGIGFGIGTALYLAVPQDELAQYLATEIVNHS